MKYYLIAGEASGDLHGANLVKAIKQLDPEAEFRGVGGDRMRAEGVNLLTHYKATSYMGFIEVVTHLRVILKVMNDCKKDILSWQPDVFIPIDFPSFNLRIAEHVQPQGTKVHWYISPQVWAWKEGRVKKIKRYVDHLLTIFPFEQEFYAKHAYEVDYVGHPLLDELDKREANPNFRAEHQLDERPIVALLPGSRRQEIKVKLPIMLQMVQQFPDYQFVVAGAGSQDAAFYKPMLQHSQAKLVMDKTYGLLEHAHAALVTSGTATMETALIGVPQVICYKGSWLSYQIGKRLVDIDYIGMPNLIMGKAIATELIQDDLNPLRLKEELTRLLSGERREKLLQDYAELREKLGGAGASARAAKIIWNYLK